MCEKGLREIADLTFKMRVVFLAQQAEIVAHRDQAAEQPLGIGHPALQDIDVDQPKLQARKAPSPVAGRRPRPPCRSA